VLALLDGEEAAELVLSQSIELINQHNPFFMLTIHLRNADAEFGINQFAALRWLPESTRDVFQPQH
jgi:hypothetical protein